MNIIIIIIIKEKEIKLSVSCKFRASVSHKSHFHLTDPGIQQTIHSNNWDQE